MPFFRKSSQAPPQVHAYDHTSIELDGFEVTIGLNDQNDLDDHQLAFVDGIVERTRTAKTAFSTRFEPRRLVEWQAASDDPAFNATCSLALQLLDCRGLTVMGAARRLVDAADKFLAAPDRGHRLRRSQVLEMRLRAREAMQECIDMTADGRPATPGSATPAHSMRLRAQAMQQAFGVFRAGDEVGLDFILDARGRAAYAFKPMTALAPRALCMTRLHGRLEQVLSDALGVDVCAGHSLAHLVSMPGPWSGLQARDPQHARSPAPGILGLLIKAPVAFDLDLSNPGDASDAGRTRLAAAMTRPPGRQAMQFLTLAALCAGEARASREGVLVDEAGRPWILRPERYLSETPEDLLGQMVMAQASDRSSADQDDDMPMRLDLQRALARVNDQMTTDDIAACCRPTDREIKVIVQGMGLDDPAADEAALALWPSRAVAQRASDRVRHLSDWARSCVQARERLLDEPACDVEELADLIERQASLTWYVSAFEKRTDA